MSPPPPRTLLAAWVAFATTTTTTLSLFPASTTAAAATVPATTTGTTTTTTTTQCNGAAGRAAPATNEQHPTAQQIVAELGLEPNPEGGYYAETFRDAVVIPWPPSSSSSSSCNGTDTDTDADTVQRSVSTAIYYLLEGPGVPSVWHRVDAAEVWHWYAGAPMVLELSSDDGSATRSHVLGPDVLDQQRPQVVIPGGDWQRAISCGDWTLVGTTVAPAFVPEGYELAPPGWEPNDGT